MSVNKLYHFVVIFKIGQKWDLSLENFWTIGTREVKTNIQPLC